jgi:hypothetical protein
MNRSAGMSGLRVTLGGAIPIDGFTLANGEAVIVLYSRAPLTPDVAEMISSGVERAVNTTDRDTLRRLASPPPGLRMHLLVANHEHGHREVIDMNAPTQVRR